MFTYLCCLCFKLNTRNQISQVNLAENGSKKKLYCVVLLTLKSFYDLGLLSWLDRCHTHTGNWRKMVNLE